MTTATARTDVQTERNAHAATPPGSRRELLAWSLATSAICLASGAWRVLLSAPIRPSDLTVVAPFDLDEIPRELSGWIGSGESQLDPVTMRITGATDHLIRSYYDEITGTSLSVLILYGPAEPVLPHTPQVCYPASGYRSLNPAVDRTIELGDGRSAAFRAAIFGRSGGRATIRQSVYHSYRLDGVWSPDVTDRSLPRRWAGIFKVQIQRQVLEGERTDGDEPIESFLRQLLPAMERMIAATASGKVTSSSASGSSSSKRP